MATFDTVEIIMAGENIDEITYTGSKRGTIFYTAMNFSKTLDGIIDTLTAEKTEYDAEKTPDGYLLRARGASVPVGEILSVMELSLESKNS